MEGMQSNKTMSIEMFIDYKLKNHMLKYASIVRQNYSRMWNKAQT